ncbi:hypothetical protein Bpla01_51450 [Burkholderia plantarii]|nr:hypothetical protein Bpla01_51450 [Burkholderia plantarii]
MEVTVPVCVAAAAVRSYRTVSPLPDPGLRRAIGGLFSVALFRVSPRMAVSHHPALAESGLSSPRTTGSRAGRDCLAHFARRILASTRPRRESAKQGANRATPGRDRAPFQPRARRPARNTCGSS